VGRVLLLKPPLGYVGGRPPGRPPAHPAVAPAAQEGPSEGGEVMSAVTYHVETVEAARREDRALEDGARRQRSRGWLTTLGIVVVIVFCLAPFYWMVVSSLRRSSDIFAKSPLPSPLSLENYGAVFHPSQGFLRALLNSLIVAGTTTVLALIIATLTAFSAESIAKAYRDFVPGVDDILVAGGGARNRTLMIMLRERIPISLKTFEEMGWEAKDREALAFAVMAYYGYHSLPNTLPKATGAKHAVIAGKLSRPWRG
jgi:hypothetical protein